jgi:hypothetical protein
MTMRERFYSLASAAPKERHTAVGLLKRGRQTHDVPIERDRSTQISDTQVRLE